MSGHLIRDFTTFSYFKMANQRTVQEYI